MKPELPTLPIAATTWSAEEALTFVAFLDGLIAAVWALHGKGMAAVLHQRIEGTPSAMAKRAE